MPTIKDVPLGQLVNLKEKVAIVYDNGLFVEIAKTLSKSFKKVYYYMPWKNGFPKSNQYIVGEGIEGIDRIQNFWDYVDKADIVIFPDIYDGDLQLELVKQGKLVWGGRKGEEMELYRDRMKKFMKMLGLYVTPFTVLKGLDALREHLKENDNVWVKQNVTRGDFETFCSKSYQVIEPVLDELEHNLGRSKFIKEFIVEDALDDAVETGVDLYTIDGNFPTETLVGIEVKDLGYVGKILPYSEISPKVTDFNDKIKPALKEYGYRGFMSTEIRVSKDKPPYMVDFCARAGSPPNELYQLMYKNLAEIIWYGACGILIDPITTKKYGVEALIHSSWADRNWQAITFPAKYRDNIKLRNAVKINGLYYAVPQAVGLPEIGAVVTEGDSIEEAVDKAREIAESIEGHYIEVKIDSINVALEQFKQLEEFGVKIL
jgi:phosphoribosylamine-glycine ligase